MSHLKNLLFVYSKDIMVLWWKGKDKGLFNILIF